MENTNFNSEDANPSEISLSLRRRPWQPIRSPFFNKLAFIISHFSSVPEERAYFSQFLPDHIRPGSGSNELERANKKEDSCKVDAPTSLECDNLSGKETMVSENSGVLSKEHQSFDPLGRVISESGHMRGDRVNDKVLSVDSGNGHVSTEAINGQEHLLNIEKILMDGTENLENLQQDTEESSFNISNALDCYWDMDMIGGGSNTVESNETGVITQLSGIMVGEVGGQKLEKGMDMEKLVSGSDVVNHPHLTLDGGPEEGEICDRSEVHDLVVDVLPEDAGALDIEKGNKESVSEDVIDNDIFTFNSLAVENSKGTGSVCDSEGMLHDDCKSQRFEFGASDGHEKDQKYETVIRDKKRKDRKAAKDPATKTQKTKRQAAKAQELLAASSACDPVGHSKRFRERTTERKENKSSIKISKSRFQSLKCICYPRDQLLELREVDAVPEDILKIGQQIEAEIFSKDQSLGGGETEGDGTPIKEKLGHISDKKMENKEKRKRRPLTEERKAKKKQKERKKRAEKNRKLGVKRLKIQPLLKPKTVTHCRHYLKGRCHEGEKCKFSHDVTPLTKSKPCCHFARQTCMKGDNCPFDHQLSKYPCNNYVTKGSCVRGDNCMFSHKIVVNEASKSTVSETKSLAPLDNSVSKQQIGTEKSCPSRTLAPISRKDDNTLCAVDQPAKVPKGLKLFSFGKSIVDDVGEKRQAGASQESGNGVETGVQPRHGASGGALNFIGASKGSQALVTPRGISSLSFDSKQANLLTKRESEFDSSTQKKPSTDKFPQSNFIAWMLQVPPSSSGLSSKNVEGGEVKRTLDSAPSALSSTLAFAAQYESVIKKKPSEGTAPPGSVAGKKTAGSDSTSGTAKNQSMKASDLFDLLYGESSKTK